MAIPNAIKRNFRTLGKAFDAGDIVLLECRDRDNGEPVYVLCAVNVPRRTDHQQEFVMVPLGLMFHNNPYESLIPAGDPEFDQSDRKIHKLKAPGADPGGAEVKNRRRRSLTQKKG